MPLKAIRGKTECPRRVSAPGVTNADIPRSTVNRALNAFGLFASEFTRDVSPWGPVNPP
jgi:hypothetical protein